jgi:hypothetical protein
MLILPDVFHGFDVVPMPAMYDKPGHIDPVIDGKCGIRGYRFWMVAVLDPENRKYGVAIDTIHSDYPIPQREYLSKMWPKGGIFAPQLPGGGGVLANQSAAVTPGQMAITLTRNQNFVGAFADILQTRCPVRNATDLDDLTGAVKSGEAAAVIVDMAAPAAGDSLRRLSMQGYTEESPFFVVVRDSNIHEDHALAMEAGAFLPIDFRIGKNGIQVFFDQAIDKWELFLARRQYEVPQYSLWPNDTETQGSPEANPKVGGWFSRLIRR